MFTWPQTFWGKDSLRGIWSTKYLFVITLEYRVILAFFQWSDYFPHYGFFLCYDMNTPSCKVMEAWARYRIARTKGLTGVCFAQSPVLATGFKVFSYLYQATFQSCILYFVCIMKLCATKITKTGNLTEYTVNPVWQISENWIYEKAYLANVSFSSEMYPH